MSSEIAAIAEQDELLTRLIGAAGLIPSDRIVAALQEPGLRERLDRLGMRHDERRALENALDSLPITKDHAPWIRRVAELKAWASQGEVERCLTLLHELGEAPAYARLAELAILKASSKRGLKDSALESLRALLIQSRKPEARSPEPTPAKEDGFRRFVRLKGAVAGGDAEGCLAIFRAIPEDDSYKKAALKLVQKVFLSRALAVVRRDPSLLVMRCRACATPLAKPKGEPRPCPMCGADIP